MRRVLVVDVVGLSENLLGPDTPHLLQVAENGFRAELGTILPAVTCSAQSSLVTGALPVEHGIVANGWYFRDLAQTWFWRQSDRLVSAPKVWERARERDSAFTCAKLFWWYNMYGDVDWSATPRPAYFADGRKAGDVYCDPPELRDDLYRELGPFPFAKFWGPGSDLQSSTWIARAARHVLQTYTPNLTFVYLPHLDYDLQRHGPNGAGISQQVRAVDQLAGELAVAARELDVEVIFLSEYGITSVSGSVSLNRHLRQAGFLRVQKALNGELLDAGASRAFAVCDHQLAHVYVREKADISAVKQLMESLDGVDSVLDRDGQAEYGLNHERSGELVAVARKDRWFDYYYWLDDSSAPDFARTVDIHQKPGFDPLEMFLNPDKPLIKLRVLGKLLRKKLGFRTLFDVIPLRPELVGGSHGRLPDSAAEGPVLISSSQIGKASRFEMTEVSELILETIFSA